MEEKNFELYMAKLLNRMFIPLLVPYYIIPFYLSTTYNSLL